MFNNPGTMTLGVFFETGEALCDYLFQSTEPGSNASWLFSALGNVFFEQPGRSLFAEQ